MAETVELHMHDFVFDEVKRFIEQRFPNAEVIPFPEEFGGGYYVSPKVLD